METQVTKQETKHLTPGDLLAQGGVEDFRPEDLQAPYITLTQAMSEACQNGEAKPGQILKEGVVLGDANNGVEVVPLTYQKFWLKKEHRDNNPKGEFRGLVEMSTGVNDTNLPEEERSGFGLSPEFVINGTRWSRTKLLQVFCLVKKDLDGGVVMPCVLWLKSGAYNRAGKALMNYFFFTKKAKGVPQYGILELGVTKRSNDLGSWFEFVVKSKNKKLEEKHYPAVAEWYGLVTQKKVVAKAEETEEDIPF